MSEAAPTSTADRPDGADVAYLHRLGLRVRELRARHGMTRKLLARDSGVSERYLANLESGRGNMSILLLRQIAHALYAPLEQLVSEREEPSVDLGRGIEVLRGLSAAELERAALWLTEAFGGVREKLSRERVALIGLRGAGKSTLGAMLAEHLATPFVELDFEIEKASGMSLAALFDLYGQAGFRRLERQALDKAIADHPRAVIAAGGGLVSDAATYERLLTHFFTVWVRASPTEHMQRTIAQGDMRPMADNRESMSDLENILQARGPLYSRADAAIVTSGRTPQESLRDLMSALKS